MSARGNTAGVARELRITGGVPGRLVLLAWVALLIGSNFYFIFRPDRTPLHWPVLTQAVVLLAFSAAVRSAPSLQRLFPFVLALSAFNIGNWLRSVIDSNIRWFQTASYAEWVLADAVVAGIPALLMVIVAVANGRNRRDLFLTRGQVSAYSTFPLLRRVRWTLLAPIVFVLTSAGLVSNLRAVAGWALQMPAFASILAAFVFATINATCEEIRFRCALLSLAEPVVGRTHAVWLTAVLFGLAHWGGHPTGMTGILMAGFFGWLLATSIVDTRGWFWAWLIHACEDVIIFLSILATGK